jgi:hypothetical protein
VGGGWTGGTAVFYAVQDGHFGRPLGLLLARLPLACRALTFFTIGVELAFAPLVFSPIRGARALALALGTALHLGIFATMRVGLFSILLPASYTIFLRPRWIDAAQGWLRARLAAAPVATAAPAAAPAAPPAATAAPPAASPRWWHAVQIAAALQFGLVAASFLPVAWPRWLHRELAVLRLNQGWSMFAPGPTTLAYQLSSTGLAADDSPVDVLAAAAPLLLPHPGFFYSRWFGYGAHLQQLEPSELEAFGAYLCRRYNQERRGSPLVRFTLSLHWRDIPAPGEPPPPWQSREILRQPCLVQARRAPAQRADPPTW